MRIKIRVIVSLVAVVFFIGLAGSDAHSWGVMFPGGGANWGSNYYYGSGHHGGGCYGGAAVREYQGVAVGFPGGNVWWGSRGHGGVRIDLRWSGFFGQLTEIYKW